jgi:hypothetical protein
LTGVVRYGIICAKKGREIMNNVDVVDFKPKNGSSFFNAEFQTLSESMSHHQLGE